jgi:hypothetical protein
MHFYATKADLLPALEKIERGISLTFARCGRYPTPTCTTYESASSIPSLGNATADSAVSCEAYLVVPRTVEVIFREIGMFDFAVDQLMNPASITFSPGGRFTSDVLLYGRVATASTTPESKALLRRFERVLKKDFHRIAAFYVGPEALALQKEGVRLTAAQQSPKEYDLKCA